MKIAKRVLLVTRGASGPDESAVRMLNANGAKVVIADMQTERNESVARDIGGTFVKCDVSQEADALAAVVTATGQGKLVTLIRALKACGKKRGVATLCIGGGEGTAMALELL